MEPGENPESSVGFQVVVREEELDGAPLVAVAALKEGVSIKEVLQAVFCRATFEKFLPNSFRHGHD